MLILSTKNQEVQWFVCHFPPRDSHTIIHHQNQTPLNNKKKLTQNNTLNRKGTSKRQPKMKQEKIKYKKKKAYYNAFELNFSNERERSNFMTAPKYLKTLA